MLKGLLMVFFYFFVRGIINLIRYLPWRASAEAATCEVLELKAVHPNYGKGDAPESFSYEFDIKITTDTGLFESTHSETRKTGSGSSMEKGDIISGWWHPTKKVFMSKKELRRETWGYLIGCLGCIGAIAVVIGILALLENLR